MISLLVSGCAVGAVDDVAAPAANSPRRDGSAGSAAVDAESPMTRTDAATRMDAAEVPDTVDAAERMDALPMDAAPPQPPSSLYDDFNTVPTWSTKRDGTTFPNGKWNLTFAGYGEVGTRRTSDGRVAYFGWSEPPNAPSNVVGNIAVGTSATQTLSTRDFGNGTITLAVRTVKQLRTYDLQHDPPNDWEHAWIFFNFKDKWHHCYFYLGTNGWELGKKDNERQAEEQFFLATGNSVKAKLGQWRKIQIKVIDNRFIISVDGVQIVDYTNDGHDGEKALSWRGGKLGLYSEDAEIEFDDVHFQP